MVYFAGPITFSPSESAALMGILLFITLLAVGLVYLFTSNIHKTLKIKSAPGVGQKTNISHRKTLTITLPIITLLFFIIWLLASMATKEARYTHGFSISTLLGNITLGLFAVSILAALYYKLKR